MPKTEHLTPRAAARALGTTPDTLARWARAGRIPVTRTAGGHRRYAIDDVQALADTRPPRPTATPEPQPEAEPGIPALLLAAARALNAAADALTHTTQETR